MTRIALLATGGTIACRQTEHGLTPALTGAELIRGIPMSRDAELVSRDVFSMDSSNIQPEEWAQLARAIDRISPFRTATAWWSRTARTPWAIPPQR